MTINATATGPSVPESNVSLLQSKDDTRHVIDALISAGVTVGLIAGAWVLSHTFHGPLKDAAAEFLASVAIVLLLVAGFSLLEWFAPAGPRQSLNGWLLNVRMLIFLYFAAELAGYFGSTLIAALRSRFGLGWINLRFDTGDGVLKLLAAFLLSKVIYDFFYYWRHRLQHRHAILWQQHKVHHLDERLAATTRGRGDWGEAFLSIAAISLPVAIFFRLNPAVAGKISGLLTLMAETVPVLSHSNIKLRFGWASVLIAGPQTHRIHHSRLAKHRDRNFASMFPLWDIVFGTYYHPARDEFPPTGIENESDVTLFSEALLVPLRGWRRMYCDWRGRNAAGDGMAHE